MAAASGGVVAVDVGTSAVRAALVTADGAVVAGTRVERASTAGGDQFDAEKLLDEVVAALAGLAGPSPAAIAISAHIGTVAVDARLRPVGPGGGWSDPRGITELHGVEEAVRARLLHASGRPALTGGALAYALTLRGVRRVRHLLSPKDFLVARLTGEVVTDSVDAAYTLASDVTTRAWNIPVLEALGIDPSWFPRQAEPAEVVGALRPAAAQACGLPAGTPVVAGGPDGSVGIGLLLGTDTATIADVAGTTDVVGRVLGPAERAPAGAVVNPALVAGRWVVGGPTGMTGGTVAWWRSLLGVLDDAEAARVPPGADGLVVLPAMTGSRFPRWQPADRGGVLGLRPEHTAAHVLRAAQEGAAFTVREGLDLLDGGQRMPVVLAGGTARSPAAAQLRADALHRTMLVCEEPDVTLLGAAALALVGSALARDPDDARTRIGCTFRQVEPDPGCAKRYDDLYGDWRLVRDTASASSRGGTLS